MRLQGERGQQPAAIAAPFNGAVLTGRVQDAARAYYSRPWRCVRARVSAETGNSEIPAYMEAEPVKPGSILFSALVTGGYRYACRRRTRNRRFHYFTGSVSARFEQRGSGTTPAAHGVGLTKRDLGEHSVESLSAARAAVLALQVRTGSSCLREKSRTTRRPLD